MRLPLILGVTLIAAAPVLAQETGEDLFSDRCAMCHVLSGKGQGPNLRGVVGRKAGSLPDFAYTPALKGSGIVWSQENIARFIANPAAMIPGTAMSIRVNDAGQRANLASYLATLR